MFLGVLGVCVAAATIPARAASPRDVVINEIAWMGTTTNAANEWIELRNTTGQAVSLSGWTLKAADNTPSINLSGSIAPYGHFLLERTDDSSVPGVTADQFYTGALSNTTESLSLRDPAQAMIDSVPSWLAGNATTRASMSRVDPTSDGTVASNWTNGTAPYTGGLGTPRAANGLPGGISDDWYFFYVTDHLSTVMPDYGPKAMATALIAAIDAAATSIDFAVYGFNGSEEIIAALDAAQARGVTVRGVVDSYADGSYPYRDTEKVIALLGNVVQDNDDRIMHNKFFVFDHRSVWTGSTNISRNEVDAEYYGDVSMLIDHTGLATAYTTEFEEMYGGAFHTAKTDNTSHTFTTLSDGTVLESYFAPTDDALTNAIVKAINKANTRIDVRTFFLTSAAVVDALTGAHNRGVAVRVILDAGGAHNEFSLHGQLRTAGIPVKVENWGGTEHHKALMADDYIVVLGSQNFTLSGNTDSDENTLYIENRPLAAAYKAYFETAWASIPSQWLTADPDPESADSPGSLSDLVDNDHDNLTDELAPESVTNLQSGTGAVNVFFLRQALTSGAQPSTNGANFNVNLETRLAARLATAVSSIDLATYELTLPQVTDTLMARAAAGVAVRLIADGKDEAPGGELDNSYQLARLLYERLKRGQDGSLGTSDDAVLFADSPIFAVADATLRATYGLPALPGGLTQVTVTIGTQPRTGYLLADAETKSGGGYYSPGDQMHNKFAVVDGTWVFTGSWNFTVNDTYGSEANRQAGILSGNTNHAIELNSTALAAIYRTEFEEMWGGSGAQPSPATSNFHSRKLDNTSHEVWVGGRRVRVYFSPGDDAMTQVTNTVANEAQTSAHFCAFAWSHQGLADALKVLWEGSAADNVGTPTGFVVQGLFEGSFWNQYWSASIDMTGRAVAGYESYSTRWATPAPVFRDREDKFLHHKYMVLDVNTTSDPAVITGSTNWSANGSDVNDENLLILYDAAIANQFYQEFAARYYMAGGTVSFLK